MTPPRRYKTAILLSGSGTNLQALIDAHQQGDFPADLALVISNKPSAYGLTRASDAGLATETISHKDYASREAFDDALHDALVAQGIEFVCLAGFMRILTPGFVNRWSGKMLNIHPSLLPAFRGHNAHEQVLESSVTLSGCSVHAVTPELDGGPLVAQAAVPRRQADDEPALATRIRAAEHILYPLAVRAFLRGEDDPVPTVPPSADMLISLNGATVYRT